jgi:SAM-dependent methyltransferase
VEAARPLATDVSLDVACGPGSVVVAFARRVRQAVGLDATEAMLEEARRLAARSSVGNVAWHRGDVYALPFAGGTFDIVSCRFAFHHLQEPARAFAEMVRVARPSGRIVLCDAFASDDPAKAAAFNAMERHRDPSTVEFRPLAFLVGLFAVVGLPEPEVRFYQVQAERSSASSPWPSPRTATAPVCGRCWTHRWTATRWAWARAEMGIRCGSRIPRRCWRWRRGGETRRVTAPDRSTMRQVPRQ